MVGSPALTPLLTLLAGGALGWSLGLRSGARRQAKAWERPPLPGLAPRRRSYPEATRGAQLRRWLQELPQGWLVLDGDNQIVCLNPSAERLLQRPLGQALVGQPLSALAPPAEVLHLIELAREKGLRQRGPWPVGGDALDLHVFSGFRGSVALLLQGRNPLQAQLEQQAEWVDDVAHELRTPITALMLVGDSLAAGAEGRQGVLVGRLQRELKRLQLLVNDLLDLSRLENTALDPGQPPGAVDPHEVLAAVWHGLAPLAAERQVDLVVAPGHDQPLWMAVDTARLHQVLLNLLDNALRYSPNGATIEVSLAHRDRWCQVTVRDHGPGLSDIDQERLFQRFYRGDPARARGPRTGSGLGLAIVRQIALSYGGLVRARNHPDGGAVLELLLPRA